MNEKKRNHANQTFKSIKLLSRVQRRSIETSVAVALDTPEQIAFQHSVLCQTSLPYRDPGPEVRVWDKKQGNISLRIRAGEAKNPETEEWVQLGIPFGPKPRLILAHLNAEALQTGSPEINVEDSLTAFVRRIQNYRPNGKEIRNFKNHLGNLSGAIIRIVTVTDNRDFQIDSKVITAFNLWFPKDEQQRVLWPSSIRLSLDYFTSLQKHAVPLDERALAGLAHSAMGLDIYAWLAQRLHRVPRKKPQFVTWVALKDQLGQDYGRIRKFREKFDAALAQVLAHYPAARIEGDGHGLTLFNSPPPVKKRFVLVDNPCR